MLIETAIEKGFSLPKRRDIAAAIDTVKWVNEHLKRTRWSYARLKEQSGKRSPQEILTDGDVQFYSCCLDLCSVSGQLLYEQGFSTNLILYESRTLFAPRGFHARLECAIEDTLHGFTMGRYGTYHFLEEALHDTHKHIYGTAFNQKTMSTPLLECFVDGGIDALHSLIPGFSPLRSRAYLFSVSTRRKQEKCMRNRYRKETNYEIKQPILCNVQAL